jgi:pre-mRNA-splicing factor SYF1
MSYDNVDTYYENEVARNPYYLKTWLQYISAKSNAAPAVKYSLYERALKHLPRSYKLWNAYLTDVSARLKGKQISDRRYIGLKSTFERSLIHMNKMPRIWCVYIY